MGVKNCTIDVFLKRIFFSTWLTQTKYTVMMTRVYKNCTFHDPCERGSCDGAWPYESLSKNDLFLSNLLLCSQAQIRQTKYMKCIIIMTKLGSTKIVNFMTLWLGVLVVRCSYISHLVKPFFLLLFLNTLGYESDKLSIY